MFFQRAADLSLQYTDSLLFGHRAWKYFVERYHVYWAEGDLAVAEERVREKLKFHGHYSNLLIEYTLNIIVS
jgi:hypothetical protein